MGQRIQFRRAKAAAWTSENPVLMDGELGLETDTRLYKIGDGITAWASLAYRTLSSEFDIIILNEQASDPAAASAGTLRMYAHSHAGRLLPKFIGPSGLDNPLQPSFFSNGIQCYMPGTTTAPQAIGGPSLTAVGTVSHPTLASTNLRTQTSRFNTVSAATANSAAELRSAVLRVWRGDAAGLGGFFHRCRFAIVSAVANQRSFFGFSSSTSAIATTQEPNALTNIIGIGNGLGQTTLRVYANDGSGIAAEVDLGASFPANDATAVYDFTLFAVPNGSTVGYEVTNLSTGANVLGTIATADLPASTQFLCWHGYMNNGGTASAVNFDCMRAYTETDY